MNIKRGRKKLNLFSNFILYLCLVVLWVASREGPTGQRTQTGETEKLGTKERKEV